MLSKLVASPRKGRMLRRAATLLGLTCILAFPRPVNGAHHLGTVGAAVLALLEACKNPAGGQQQMCDTLKELTAPVTTSMATSTLPPAPMPGSEPPAFEWPYASPSENAAFWESNTVGNVASHHTVEAFSEVDACMDSVKGMGDIEAALKHDDFSQVEAIRSMLNSSPENLHVLPADGTGFKDKLASFFQSYFTGQTAQERQESVTHTDIETCKEIADGFHSRFTCGWDVLTSEQQDELKENGSKEIHGTQSFLSSQSQDGIPDREVITKNAMGNLLQARQAHPKSSQTTNIAELNKKMG